MPAREIRYSPPSRCPLEGDSMGGSLKTLLAVLMFLFGLLLMAAGFFGLMSQAPLTQPGDDATSLVMGGFGFFLVLLAVVWAAVK